MDVGYEKKYYELEKDQWWCKSRRELIFGLLKKESKNAKILEIGCSGGYLLEALKRVGFGGLAGVDISPVAVSLCRKKNLEAYVMDGSALLFPDNEFDVIIASDVLEHIEDDKSALASWFRVLKPGGLLICFAPAYQFLWSYHDVVNKHKRRYILHKLYSLAQESGFRVRKASYWDFFLFPAVLAVRSMQRIFSIFFTVKPKDQFYTFGGGFLNSLLLNLMRLENILLLLGLKFFVGVSCFIVAQKPLRPKQI